MLRGERIDRPTYSFLHTIDEGNTAVCFRGYHEIYNIEVVQKTIATLGIPDAIAREPQLLRQVRHDRIIEVMEAQWDPEHTKVQAITFVTPYQEGGSVYTALVEGHLFGVRQTQQIADDILVGLDAMHAQHNLVHRDIKPANLLLDAQRWRARLADLGCAAFLSGEGQTADGRVGSPLYRSPEAVLNGRVSAASDLYSLGVTLIEMLNGPFPYDRLDHDSIDARLGRGWRALPASYYLPAFWVPPSLSRLVRRLCNTDPAKRPASAAAALRELRDLKLVDWRRVSGSDLTGTWQGYWPPQSRRRDQRIFEVTVRPVERGSAKGMLKARARWRTSNGAWRNYAKLDATLAPSPEDLREFFEVVNREAQSTPTR